MSQIISRYPQYNNRSKKDQTRNPKTMATTHPMYIHLSGHLNSEQHAYSVAIMPIIELSYLCRSMKFPYSPLYAIQTLVYLPNPYTIAAPKVGSTWQQTRLVNLIILYFMSGIFHPKLSPVFDGKFIQLSSRSDLIIKLRSNIAINH